MKSKPVSNMEWLINSLTKISSCIIYPTLDKPNFPVQDAHNSNTTQTETANPKQWHKTMVVNSWCVHGKGRIYLTMWARTADRKKSSIIRLEPSPASVSAFLCRQAHSRLKTANCAVPSQVFPGVVFHKHKAVENPQGKLLTKTCVQFHCSARRRDSYREDLQS
jgi:hypothetical protein